MTAPTTKQSIHIVQMEKALAYLVRNPGKTSLEIATHEGVDRYFLARRFNDLRKTGLAISPMKRMCTISTSKSTSLVWHPTKKGRQSALIQ